MKNNLINLTLAAMFLAMAFELAAYAFVAGFLYEKSRWQCIKALYAVCWPL